MFARRHAELELPNEPIARHTTKPPIKSVEPAWKPFHETWRPITWEEIVALSILIPSINLDDLDHNLCYAVTAEGEICAVAANFIGYATDYRVFEHKFGKAEADEDGLTTGKPGEFLYSLPVITAQPPESRNFHPSFNPPKKDD